jgi:hypothetical protein
MLKTFLDILHTRREYRQFHVLRAEPRGKEDLVPVRITTRTAK